MSASEAEPKVSIRSHQRRVVTFNHLRSYRCHVRTAKKPHVVTRSLKRTLPDTHLISKRPSSRHGGLHQRCGRPLDGGHRPMPRCSQQGGGENEGRGQRRLNTRRRRRDVVTFPSNANERFFFHSRGRCEQSVTQSYTKSARFSLRSDK